MSQQYYNACFLVWAIPIFRALNEVAMNRSLPSARRSAVMRIATHLGLAYHALKLVPAYWVESEVDTLCQNLLKDFTVMIRWPQSWRAIDSIHDIHTLLSLQVQKNGQLKGSSMLNFFESLNSQHLIDALDDNSSHLYKLIDNGNDGDGDDLPTNFNPISKNHFIDFGKDLFDALELHIKCNPNEFGMQDDHKSQEWHPTRLCLIEEEHNFPSISLLISPMQMAYWQDFHLVMESNDSIVVDDNASPQPAFCNLVDTQHYARVEIGFDASKGQFQLHESKFLESEPGPGRGENLADVLHEFELTPKDKVILAYTIAQAYHHFYDSDLMRIKWTSKAIWFMPPTMGKDEIPLRPYLIFPFGIHNDPEEDFVDNAMLVHQHPRILAFGILLLEIGLSKPFQSIPQRNSIAQANCDHKIADNWLKELKNMKWDGFVYKSLLDKAAEYCIREGKLLVGRQTKLGPVGVATDSSTTKLPDKQQGVLARRKKFYKNVVLPLKYLAETGFKHQNGNKLYIHRKKTDASQTKLPNQLSQPDAAFHTGRAVKPDRWLEDLNLIGTMVERQRRTHKVKTAIRVAILDTGIYEKDMDNASWRINHTRNFVTNSAAGIMDTFGHGTLMTRLVMKCAPSAEIIIARVAESTGDLQDSQENIKNAILWAGRECQADIISMSFGFPKDHKGIDNAIKTIQSERGESVLFLASAGNSSSEDENFPARHLSVISIHAVNCRGTFMETNPRLRDGAPAIWGTYGSDIPDGDFPDIREKHPNVCQPGSSIATAVAAGISATMIAYADLLPYLEPSVEANDGMSRLKLLRRKSGMEAIFKSMVKKNGDSRMWFVDPISFWRDTSDEDVARHFTRYSTIHSCLQDVNSKQGGVS
ncbi:hypothetical protein V8C42DRAFT_318490 [Trichoderma barbatum]